MPIVIIGYRALSWTGPPGASRVAGDPTRVRGVVLLDGVNERKLDKVRSLDREQNLRVL